MCSHSGLLSTSSLGKIYLVPVAALINCRPLYRTRMWSFKHTAQSRRNCGHLQVRLALNEKESMRHWTRCAWFYLPKSVVREVNPWFSHSPTGWFKNTNNRVLRLLTVCHSIFLDSTWLFSLVYGIFLIDRDEQFSSLPFWHFSLRARVKFNSLGKVNVSFHIYFRVQTSSSHVQQSVVKRCFHSYQFCGLLYLISLLWVCFCCGRINLFELNYVRMT